MENGSIGVELEKAFVCGDLWAAFYIIYFFIIHLIVFKGSLKYRCYDFF